MTLTRTFALALVAGFPVAACSGATSSSPSASDFQSPQATNIDTTAPVDEIDLRTAMHDVFQDEAQWARFYVVRAPEHGADVPVITARLMRSEDAIVATLEPWYGAAFADSLTTLLHERASGLMAIVTATTSSATTTINLRSDWLANAAKIASLLVAATPTPSLSFGTLQNALDQELLAVLDQIDARAGAAWNTDVQAYGRATTSATAVADLVTDGMKSWFLRRITPTTLSSSATTVYFMYRQLFDDNAFWMRSSIITHLARTPDEAYAEDAVANTTTELSNVFRPFFTSDTSVDLGWRLHDVTITDGFAYMLAAEAGDGATASQLHQQWTTDARALVQSFATQDSAVNLGGWLGVYVDGITEEINARIATSWASDASSYSVVLTNARSMSYRIANAAEHLPPVVN